MATTTPGLPKNSFLQPQSQKESADIEEQLAVLVRDHKEYERHAEVFKAESRSLKNESRLLKQLNAESRNLKTEIHVMKKEKRIEETKNRVKGRIISIQDTVICMQEIVIHFLKTMIRILGEIRSLVEARPENHVVNDLLRVMTLDYVGHFACVKETCPLLDLYPETRQGLFKHVEVGTKMQSAISLRIARTAEEAKRSEAEAGRSREENEEDSERDRRNVS
jgi:hypothetical protein